MDNRALIARIAAAIDADLERQSEMQSGVEYYAMDEVGVACADMNIVLSELAEAACNALVNTPETADFVAGVPLEATHQRERWGAEHDAGKTPFDWFWLVGYLAQKAAASAVAGDIEKAKHHTISTAAALANWHAALSGIDSRMRPGIEPPEQEVAA